MSRLYKFFCLLFLSLLAISFVYAVLVSMGVYQLTTFMKPPSVVHIDSSPPLSAFLRAGLWNAVVFTTVQFFSLVFAFRMAFRQQKKFTVHDMVQYCKLFFLLTTAAFILFAGWFAIADNYLGMLYLAGNFFGLPAPLWWLFPLLWSALFIFLAEKIKNKPEYGS